MIDHDIRLSGMRGVPHALHQLHIDGSRPAGEPDVGCDRSDESARVLERVSSGLGVDEQQDVVAKRLEPESVLGDRRLEPGAGGDGDFVSGLLQTQGEGDIRLDVAARPNCRDKNGGHFQHVLSPRVCDSRNWSSSISAGIRPITDR